MIKDINHQTSLITTDNADYLSCIIEEVNKMINDNIKLLLLNDKALILLKDYCNKIINNTNYLPISYDLLVTFVREAINDLITSDYLYDFRDME